MSQHAVVRVAQFFELVPGSDVGPLVEIAVGHRIGNIFQMQHRLHNDISHNQIGNGHGQEPCDQCECNQQGIIAGNLFLSILQRKTELCHRH